MHTAIHMSRSLKQIVDKYLATHARTQLAATIGKSDATLSRWLRKGVPTGPQAYNLALACGCSPQEATRLAADECPYNEVRTA